VAIGPILESAYGRDRRAYHLTADYTWGWTTEASIRETTESRGWNTVNAVKTPLDTINFKHFLRPVRDAGADVLVLNHYGRNMISSLRQAVSLGLRDLMVDGRQLEIVVPLFSKIMADGAGDAADGIYGTSNWHWSLDDPASRVFTRSFGREYGEPPSQAAHTSYVQTLLYADAAERAGTFDPQVLIPALEGHEFDGLGNGPTLYRAADHQCFKEALVMQGRSGVISNHERLGIVDRVARQAMEYDTNRFPGDLGPL
nr:ABC transporter substrate-binding protein [Paracoccaceae bacterium]